MQNLGKIKGYLFRVLCIKQFETKKDHPLVVFF